MRFPAHGQRARRDVGCRGSIGERLGRRKESLSKMLFSRRFSRRFFQAWVLTGRVAFIAGHTGWVAEDLWPEHWLYRQRYCTFIEAADFKIVYRFLSKIHFNRKSQSIAISTRNPPTPANGLSERVIFE